MTISSIKQCTLALIVGLAMAMLTMPHNALGQEPSQEPSTNNQQPAANQQQAATTAQPAEAAAATPAGKKEKASGVVVRRDPDSFVLREDKGRDLVVKLTNSTKVMEKKSNPFRGAKHYATTNLMRGLPVEVEGRADSAGALVAERIRFTGEDYKVAQSVESRVNPVEGRLNWPRPG